MTHKATVQQHHHQVAASGHDAGGQQQQQQQQQPPVTVKPKAVFFWNNADVMKWLKRHCEDYYGLYGQLFLEHEITGRQLVRMNDVTLQRMGINEAQHRDDLCRIIMKLKLKTDILEMKDLEKKSGSYAVNSSSSSVTVGTS